MKNLLVSVLIPVHNEEKIIDKLGKKKNIEIKERNGDIILISTRILGTKIRRNPPRF